MARKRKDSELVLAGGEKPQVRKGSKKSWTKAKETTFLIALAETCNVMEACRQAGVSTDTVYRRRKSDAAFRAAWVEALSAAYQRLEMVLLKRAFDGVEKVTTRKDGSEERMVEYSNQLGLSLLKLHRDTVVEASTEILPENIEEIRERLIAKLQRLKKRYDAEDRASA